MAASKKPARRSPLKGKPLRSPGDSLREAMLNVWDTEFSAWFVVTLFAVALAGLEWWRWFNPVPPSPRAVTLVALVVTVVGVLKMRRSLSTLDRLRLGRDGERIVGELLEDLRSDGYRVFHDVPGEGFNVDHVLIGPPGVLVVETKTISKRVGRDAWVTFDGRRITVDGYELSEIMHSWRSFTAKEINKALGRTGEFWQKESFDHIVRSPAHFEKFREYIQGHEEAACSRLASGAAEQEKRRDAEGDQRKRRDAASTTTLQVAVARLLGHRWPAELDVERHEGREARRHEGEDSKPMRLSKRARELTLRCRELLPFADSDGIVCIPAVRGEDPAAERLFRLLAACGGSGILPLQSAAGSRSHLDLDDWLRNAFFEEHCKLFHDRPFVWHIWDGRKRDGFHALVNYHKLCGVEAASSRFASDKRQDAASTRGRRLLEKLTYAYLGEWITRQKDGVKRGEGGAEDRLAAALELQKRLEAILAGEPPFDIFVRWKPLAEQPIGWEPDINDGVRINIRPFLASDLPGGRTGAGVLRWKPNIKWTKDRGKEPQRLKAEYPWFWGWDENTVDFAGSKSFDGNRHNDCHYSNKVKQAARDGKAGK